MQEYNPSQAPDPEEWLSLDESERVELVENFHIILDEEVPEGSEKMHAIIHVTVENQILSETESISPIVAKLIRQGLNRHEAIHAVGSVFSEFLFNLQQKGVPWNQKRYIRRLHKLTAKRWRRGQW